MKGWQRALIAFGKARTAPESGNCRPTSKIASSEALSGDFKVEEMARQVALMASGVPRKAGNWAGKERGKSHSVFTNHVIQNACAMLRARTRKPLVVT